MSVPFLHSKKICCIPMNSGSSVPPLIEALTSGRTWIGNDFEEVGEQADQRRILRRELESIDRPVAERGGLYDSLNRLLETGDNDRFVLYCPLCLVPNADWYRRYDESVDVFSELYIQSWFRLLHTYDVRANFVDGDVPDIELAEDSLEMRVQAAYLVPALIKKGLVTLNQINTDDDILHLSLCEAMGQAYEPRSYRGLVSDKRARWLEWEKERQAILEKGRVLGDRLISGGSPELAHHAQGEVLIVAIGHAIERSWILGQKEYALSLLERFDSDLQSLSAWHDLSGMLGRLCNLGVIDRAILDDYGVSLPNLNGPLHSNLDTIVTERRQIQEMVTDPGLQHIIFPAAIIYGSRLKGYGGRDSDIDIAVFIRPEYRGNPTDILRRKFGQTVVEYWLTDDYAIRDFPDVFLPNIGDSISADILLCGAWEGDEETISMLGRKVLRRFFTEPNQQVREVWLREMERNLLQYRLLHRGYERYHITNGPTFLDEGYRATASKLFASHVFLPTINGT